MTAININPVSRIMLNKSHLRQLAVLVSVASIFVLSAPLPAAEKTQYNRDIRPILAENCFACHGPDSAARKKDLRLDRREDALKAEAFVPGKPEESAIIDRIFSDKPGEMMPPKKSHKKLTPAQKETLKRWVAEGAEYQPHWSFIAPNRPPLPAVKNDKWIRNPIDRFILAELEKNGLQPAPEADRWTLARRLSLDLTGLPPDPKDVEAFVADQSADAYERYVDKLLKSPHWGEHRGRYWLDAARFADTHGIHFDNFREMWAYRDWVLRAFNDNMPFDRMTIEQLAGDLLPDPTLDQRVATGFNRCNITTNEGGVIGEEYLVLYTRDRTEAASQVWMGLTTGCAVCHDHKFDPISQREFYSMAAYFNNTTQGAMDGNIPNTPPVLIVPRTEDRGRWEAVTKDLNAIKASVEVRKKSAKTDFDKWLAGVKVEQVEGFIPRDKLQLRLPLTEGQGKSTKYTFDGKDKSVEIPGGYTWADKGKLSDKAYSLAPDTNKPAEALTIPEAGDFDKGQPFTASAWVQITHRGRTGAIVSRMDNANNYRGWDLWIEGDRIGMHIVSSWPADALKVVARTPLQPRQWYHVAAVYDGSGKAGGVKMFLNGAAQPVDVAMDTLKSTTKTTAPFKVGQRNTSERLSQSMVQDVQLFSRALAVAEVGQLAGSSRVADLLRKPAAQRTPAEVNELHDWWLATLDGPTKELTTKVGSLQQEEAAIRSRGTVAHVMQEKAEEPIAYILFRGDYDKRRDKVKAATPQALPAMPAELPKNRLGFAQWLLRPEHPLTARVTVNRFWQEVYGTGLVRTSGDFGITGELPSHAELLDWLAVEFRETGWDVKRFFKIIVLSSTYRQSAVITPEKKEKDAHNRLLSRGPRFRMDAEMIRDYALASSGLLVRKLGGPSVKPYQPEGVWEAVAMIGSNTRDYRPDAGESLYRRSMYTFWKRSAPPASMDILNAPNRETCTVRRERTNTPLQALVTLNDPQYIEAARVLAQRVLQDGGTKPEQKLDALAKRLIARPWQAEETRLVEATLNDLLAHYKANPAEAKKLIAVGESKADPNLDPAALAAWTMLANQLMNLDEVLNK